MNAPDKVTEIKGTATAIAAIITGIIGWAGWAVMLFLALIIIDWTTGSCAAKKAGDWNSSRSREGRWHKVGEIVAVVAAFMCDIALKIGMTGLGIELPIDYDTLFGPLVTMWYIFTEIGSIAENAQALGAPVPNWLTSGIKNSRTRPTISGTSELGEQQPSAHLPRAEKAS